MNLAEWNYVDVDVLSDSEGKGVGLLCFLFVAACIISGKAQCVVCNHCVNQNPITAEVIDTSLQAD